jgi:hypothetical protein
MDEGMKEPKEGEGRNEMKGDWNQRKEAKEPTEGEERKERRRRKE